MGRVCAWCGSVIHGASQMSKLVSHVLCTGCGEDLRAALADNGMRPTDGASGGSAG